MKPTHLKKEKKEARTYEKEKKAAFFIYCFDPREG